MELAFPAETFDITGDGVRDAFVPLECVTGDASSFTELEVFDGASDPRSPRRLGILTNIPSYDGTYEDAIAVGVKVRGLEFADRQVTIVGDMYVLEDPKACPSIRTIRTAIWDGSNFTISEGSRASNIC